MKAYRNPPLAWKKNCLVQTTPWSPCSKTCGLGISVRVNNDNSKCEMRKDQRLCLLRPCDPTQLRRLMGPGGRVCRAEVAAPRAERLVLSGCSSTLKVRPTYCGVCTAGRCCVPDSSHSRTLEFSCRGGTRRWDIQWITSCVCQTSCQDPGDMFSQLHFL
ncbi:hypothetical protein CRUP_010035 [Coryphaenoides rupestris]|nr:hypothetical protein CRUP_010035 [Coryphaenoides rupestris]